MARPAILAFIASIGTSAVHGGVVVSLVPDSPGPYFGGESLDVAVWLGQDPGGSDIFLRGLRFDFNASDPGIVLKSFTWNFSGQRICSLVPDGCGAGYEQFRQLVDADGAIVNNVFLSRTQSIWNQIKLPATGMVVVGHLNINLPSAPGNYLLDAMNAEIADGVNVGAGIDFGFEMRTTLVPSNGLSGGYYAFTVIPEPSTVMLLGLGGVAVAMRRRMA